ncbi:MAG: MBL fold metallo-hydrolase [candidate division Zixibacteria bacterium]|nr:MBL fold metallo-hydrolase [candidate division Zixibacteria bacterium]
MPKLQIIGCSSGMPEASIANSSYLLHHKNKLYLFDCGEGTSSAMLRLKVNYQKIGQVFISHAHPDHVIGIPGFIQMNHLSKRTMPLDIYLPGELVKPLEKILYATYLIPENLTFDWTLFSMKPNPVFRDNDDISVNIFPNEHLYSYEESIKANNLKNKMNSYCFSVATGKTKMVYSGDLASADDLSKIIENTDLLLTEGMHIDLDDIFKAAGNSGVKTVVLTHLPVAWTDKRGRIQDKAVKYGVDDLRFAEEGETYNY